MGGERGEREGMTGRIRYGRERDQLGARTGTWTC